MQLKELISTKSLKNEKKKFNLTLKIDETTLAKAKKATLRTIYRRIRRTGKLQHNWM